jgi:hypothetical protein
VLQDNQFTVMDWDDYRGDWIWTVSGLREGETFTGTWQVKEPSMQGTWTAERSQTLCYDEFYDAHGNIIVGKERHLSLGCGIEPYVVLVSPDPEICSVEGIADGFIVVKGIAPGETTVTVGDASFYQLTVEIPVRVKAE